MTKQEKLEKLLELLLICPDTFLWRFISPSSTKKLDEKIAVVKAIIAGKAPSEIPDYYDCMDTYPKDFDGCWD